MALSGGCRCGACRYTLEYSEAPVTYTCHCLDCQTSSGSSFALQALVPMSRLAVDGELIEWAHTNAQGKVTTQRFCAVCKTRLYSVSEVRPGMAIIRAGTLDDSAEIVPAAHLWTKRKKSWVGLPADAETYDEGIPPARAIAIFGPNFI